MATEIKGKITEYTVVDKEAKDSKPPPLPKPKKRPAALPGITYQAIAREDKFYVTVNNFDDQLWEAFIATKKTGLAEYLNCISVLLSLLLQHGVDVAKIQKTLAAVQSPDGGYFAEQRRVNSLAHHVGILLGKALERLNGVPASPAIDPTPSEQDSKEQPDSSPPGDQCPECKNYTLHNRDGCPTCSECGYSKCG